jgi:hypothetical protein
MKQNYMLTPKTFGRQRLVAESAQAGLPGSLSAGGAAYIRLNLIILIASQRRLMFGGSFSGGSLSTVSRVGASFRRSMKTLTIGVCGAGVVGGGASLFCD